MAALPRAVVAAAGLGAGRPAEVALAAGLADRFRLAASLRQTAISVGWSSPVKWQLAGQLTAPANSCEETERLAVLPTCRQPFGVPAVAPFRQASMRSRFAVQHPGAWVDDGKQVLRPERHPTTTERRPLHRPEVLRLFPHPPEAPLGSSSQISVR